MRKVWANQIGIEIETTTTTTLRFCPKNRDENMKQDNFTLLSNSLFHVFFSLFSEGCVFFLSLHCCYFGSCTIILYEKSADDSRKQSSKILCVFFFFPIVYECMCGLTRIVYILQTRWARSVLALWIICTRHRTWWEWHLWGIFARCAIYSVLSCSRSCSSFNFPGIDFFYLSFLLCVCMLLSQSWAL